MGLPEGTVLEYVLSTSVALIATVLAVWSSLRPEGLTPVFVQTLPAARERVPRLLTSGTENGKDRDRAALEASTAANVDHDPRLEVLKERIAVLARLIGESRTPQRPEPGG